MFATAVNGHSLQPTVAGYQWTIRLASKPFFSYFTVRMWNAIAHPAPFSRAATAEMPSFGMIRDVDGLLLPSGEKCLSPIHLDLLNDLCIKLEKSSSMWTSRVFRVTAF